MADNIEYLTHYTSMSNLLSIIKNGFLYTSIERSKNKIKYEGILSLATKSFTNKDYSKEFPGIFMRYMTKDSYGENVKYGGIDNVILIFNKKILKQKNYHINIIDNNGYNTEGITFYPHNLDKLPSYKSVYDYYYKIYNDFPGNEVVFHDKINLNLCCSIWVKTRESYDKLIKILPKKYIPNVKIKKTYTGIRCGIDEKYLDMKSIPFYISLDHIRSGYKHIYPYKTKIKSSKGHYKQIAKIAGIEDYVIEKMGLTNPKKLDEYLVKNKKYTYFHTNRNKQNLIY